jgi:transcriptional regulator with XRE-family HTH domain
VNRTYLSKLEKGVSYPGLEIIAKLATVLECKPLELQRIGQNDLQAASKKNRK